MTKLSPINDWFMVELEKNPHNFVGGKSAEEGVRSGTVVDISKDMPFFGFNTFMFDSSLMNEQMLANLHKHYRTYVGKKVYWPELSESGTVIQHEGKEYAFVKMSALMAVETR